MSLHITMLKYRFIRCRTLGPPRSHFTTGINCRLVNLFVFVERVDDQFHHTINFCLKCMLFSFVMQFFHLRYTQAIQLDCLFLPANTQH